MTIAPELLRRIVEGALLAAGQPLTEDRLLSLIDEGERPEKSELRAVLEQIAESGAERGFELKQVASGWRFQVPEDLAPWVNRLWEEKPQKYSRAILETLAIIAYRQPITRGDIEEIRGVAVSSHIVKTLSERGWIKVVGQRDVPGKPSLYATTREFLDYFNLRTLDDLPTLAEIRDIDSLNRALDLEQSGMNGAEEDAGEGENTEAESAAAEDVEGENPEAAEGESPGGESAGNESTPSAAGEQAQAEKTAEEQDSTPAGAGAPQPQAAEAGAGIAAVAASGDAGGGGEAETGIPAGDVETRAEPVEETGGSGIGAAPADEIGAETPDFPATGIEAETEEPAKAGESVDGEDPQIGSPQGLAAELPPSSLFAADDGGAAADDRNAREDAEHDSETRDTEQMENITP